MITARVTDRRTGDGLSRHNAVAH